MSSPDELRSCAVDCARLARSASDPRDKARLLSMARAWANLAARIENLRGLKGCEPTRDGDDQAPAALGISLEPSTSGQT